jgi:hypothetical protein
MRLLSAVGVRFEPWFKSLFLRESNNSIEDPSQSAGIGFDPQPQHSNPCTKYMVDLSTYF